jgi:tetratricopeptide (TPR) repeat protein
MLFDLRGRGRRRTIQVIYLGLAVVLGGGLILFGVGTGGGGGGLLNAFNPSGGSSAANAYVSAQTKKAEKQTKLDPTNAQAWASLVQARYQDASAQGYDQATETYTASGKADLAAAGSAWQQYLKLDKHPDSTLARLMGEAYQSLGDYKQDAQAWEYAAQSAPNVASYWEYVAQAAYLGKEADLGDLAAAKAIGLTPKAERATLETQFKSLKAQATTTATTTPAVTTTTTTAAKSPTKTTKTKTKTKK